MESGNGNGTGTGTGYRTRSRLVKIEHALLVLTINLNIGHLRSINISMLLSFGPFPLTGNATLMKNYEKGHRRFIDFRVSYIPARCYYYSKHIFVCKFRQSDELID